MPVWVTLALFVLASARITGLITLDELTRPAREAFTRRLDEDRPSHRALAYLTSCPWCASIYVCAVLAPVFWWWGDRPAVAVPALALGGSQAVGMLSGVGRRDED
jgi:hypothetical protein